jgi:hypothetical protein
VPGKFDVETDSRVSVGIRAERQRQQMKKIKAELASLGQKGQPEGAFLQDGAAPFVLPSNKTAPYA